MTTTKFKLRPYKAVSSRQQVFIAVAQTEPRPQLHEAEKRKAVCTAVSTLGTPRTGLPESFTYTLPKERDDLASMRSVKRPVPSVPDVYTAVHTNAGGRVDAVPWFGGDPRIKEWIYTASQVLRGEFDNADSSMRGALRIGLRSIGTKVTTEAIARLDELDRLAKTKRKS
jgi:hypothetical protein